MDPIYELQAETLRTLAHPRRLEILHELAAEPSTVGRLADRIGLTQPNVSQHLALMRNSGVVIAERQGREIRYRLADEDVLRACALMRQALRRRLVRLASATVSSGFDTGRSPVPVRSNDNGAAAFSGPLLRHR
jgi:ArsR family transcriptional regulator